MEKNQRLLGLLVLLLIVAGVYMWIGKSDQAVNAAKVAVPTTDDQTSAPPAPEKVALNNSERVQKKEVAKKTEQEPHDGPLIHGLNDNNPRDPETIQLALIALPSPNVHVRRKAIWDLRAVGPNDDYVVEPLLKAIDDEDPIVRVFAMQALGRVRSLRALPTIRAKLKTDEIDMKISAVRALAEAGPMAREAVPELKHIAEGKKEAKDMVLANAAAKAMLAIGGEEAEEALRDPRVSYALYGFEKTPF